MRRIRNDLMFEDGAETEADEVWAAMKSYLRDMQIKSLAMEKSFIAYEECHHDETPPRPCEIIERFEK